MRWTVRIVQWSAAALAGLALLAALALAWVAFVPPKLMVPAPRSVPDHSAYALDEKVAWYSADDGTRWMVTWGADGDLTLTDMKKVQNYYLLPVTSDRFTWRNHKTQEDYPVEFRRGPEGGVTGFGWTTPDGRTHSAARLPDDAYHQSEVRFTNGEVPLAGLLLEPVSPGSHPAVVFIHGSGVSDRDMLWYLQMADYLARREIVVLLPDKRGCGKSGGQWHTSSFQDYAEDALAAVKYLRQLPSVDPRGVGLIGMSQGGWVAPLAAAQSDEVAFIVSYSGSAAPLRDTVCHELSCDIRDSGVPRWLVPVVEPAVHRRVLKELPDFWRINGAYDPIEYWRRLCVPALVLNGREDKNVPVAASVARLEAVRRPNPKADITILVYEGSGHLIEDPGTKWTREEALQTMADWIHRAAVRPE